MEAQVAELQANQKTEFQLSSEELQARAEHRKWIGGRALTLLSHYWREEDNETLLAAMGKDWADVLEGIPQPYIQQACICYQREEPRRKPTPGAIYQMALEIMPMPKTVYRKVPETKPRIPCDPAVAQKICEEAGYKPKRFTDV